MLVARLKKGEAYKHSSQILFREVPKRRDYFEDACIVWRIILKPILKE
jgi:hypothetical protein